MKSYLLLQFVLLTSLWSFSQDNYWVSTKLPAPFPSQNQYALGETCLIFATDTSRSVHAFDINKGEWQLLLVPTELDWIDAAADGNVAMIYNDSIVVAYSAITSSFSALSFSGSIVTLNMTPFCIENLAYFITDQFFYVFDAEEGEWHSYGYTPPGSAPWGGGVSGKEDYIYMSIYPKSGASISTWIAYSLHTKTFTEFTQPYQIFFKQLDHGFTFTTSNKDPYLCGGYSAITGQYSTKTHSRGITEKYPSVYEELVSPLICDLFVCNEESDGNDYIYHMWVYNTMIGDFAEYSFHYTYNGSHYVNVWSLCGGQTAFVIIKNVDKGNLLECLAYSAETNEFTLFDTPLYNWGSMSFSAGGLIIDGYDENNYFLYDVQTKKSFTHPVQWAESIEPGIKARGLSNYWSVFAFSREYDDTTHVLSYTRDDGKLSAFDIPPVVSTSNYRGADFFGLVYTELGVPAKTYLFSPLYNNWTEKDFESSSYGGAESNYFYINYTDINQTYFYDAMTNEEFLFPSAQTYRDVLARDSLFLMYSDEGKYIGYSIIDHSSVEYEISKLSGQQWNNFIVLNSDIDRVDQLLFDAYHNIFAPLTLTEETGKRKNNWVGGKTALIATENGYLYAYSSKSVGPVGVDKIEAAPLSELEFQLFPNPAKGKFRVQSQLFKGENVIVEIFDLNGRKILNNNFPAGREKIEIDVNHLQSGVYVCKLSTENKSVTKKIIVQK
ncbi:MAG TPA: T9SS type A sorting domain-containing protein [Bacteroidales bacterium]|nr:T9SS type A sorting domain-containing protein [Bacteroidales bacterium]